jgi:hypothetical protein
MSAEQPVRCGCGGKALSYEDAGVWTVECSDCTISACANSKEKAVSFWNLAMGAKLREAVKSAVEHLRDPDYDPWDVSEDLGRAMKEDTP